MPISSPPWTSARSWAGSASIVSRSFSSAGLPASSLDDVAVGGGDRQLRPDRRGALRDARQHLDAVEPHADRALVDHLLAEEQRAWRRRPPAPRRGRRAPGTAGAASDRKRSTASVGNVAGSASMITPAAPVEVRHPRERAGALLDLLDDGVERRRRRRRRAARPRPRPRCPPRPRAARRSRRPRRSRRARRARAPRGPPRAPPRAPRGACRRRTRPRGRTARPSSPSRAVSAASSAPARGSGLVDRPAPMWTGMPRTTILRPVPPPTIVALFGPTGVGKTAVAIALAERLRAERRGPGRRVRRRAAGLPRPRDPHRRGHAAGAGAARAPAARRSCPSTRRSAPASTRGCAHARDRRPARGRPPADRRRRHRPVPARRARRARPAPARPAADPRPPPRRPRARAARRRSTTSSPSRGPGSHDPRHRRPAHRPRARAARRRPRAARRRAAVDRGHAPPDAARRPDDGARGAEARGSTSASTRWSRAGAADEVRARRRRRVDDRAQGARLPASCSPATSRR